MIKAIALDDEPLALDIIENMGHRIKNFSVERTFTKQIEALKYIHKFDIDILFLDIQMPKCNGFEFYKKIDKDIKVIFTTAYEEYALEGFAVQAVDYLVKPFSFARFQQAAERAIHLVQLERNSPTENTTLSIRADYKLHNIELSKILYIEGYNDYVKIHITDQKSIVARATLKSLLKKLPNTDFIRVHRSYILPKKNIKLVEQQHIVLGQVRIPISKSYREGVMQLFD